MVKVRVSGDWNSTEGLLRGIGRKRYASVLPIYGDRGVAALAKATPVDTGVTAASWRYEISERNGEIRLTFHNDNIQDGVNVALVVNYGHATRNGGWVEGREFIEPAIRDVFDELADELWREVKKG